MAKSDWSVIVSAEHASNELPDELGNLGVSAKVLASHVAWDPGARPVAKALAEALQAPAFYGEWSRLLADLNRSADNDEVVPENAFGADVPGNRGLSAAARAARIERYHQPYWSAVQHALQTALEEHPARRVLHVSIHSFAGELHGEKRSVELGLLFDPARPLEQQVSVPMLESLRSAGFDARANEPYVGWADALTTACRKLYPAERHAGIELELSQNLLHRIPEISTAVLRAVQAVIAT